MFLLIDSILNVLATAVYWSGPVFWALQAPPSLMPNDKVTLAARPGSSQFRAPVICDSQACGYPHGPGLGALLHIITTKPGVCSMGRWTKKREVRGYLMTLDP